MNQDDNALALADEALGTARDALDSAERTEDIARGFHRIAMSALDSLERVQREHATLLALEQACRAGTAPFDGPGAHPIACALAALDAVRGRAT